MYEICIKIIDQFVNQDSNLVLIGKHQTAVIFDWLWPKGPLVSCQYHTFLAQSQSSCTLERKKLMCAREGVGNDILTSAIPDEYIMTNMYICMRGAKEVSSTSLSFCFPLLEIIQKN